MNTNSFFDIDRLKHLVVRQLLTNYKTLLIGAGAIVGFLLFFGTIALVFFNLYMDKQIILRLTMPFFFVGGYLFSSITFSELNSPHRGYLYITLPASAFEKLISAWVISSLIYGMVAGILLYFINIFYILASGFTSQSVVLLNLFSPGVLKILGIYLVTQSIFFLGALYYRRVNFLKTILGLFIIAFIISLYSVIAFKLVFFSSPMYTMINFGQLVQFEFLKRFSVLTKILFWGCTAPFFLVVSYFRLKEREV